MTDEQKKSPYAEFWQNPQKLAETPDNGLTVEERRAVATMMAFNAAFVQLMREGIIPFGQDIHWHIHVNEFAQRLFEGKKVDLPGIPTLQVDTALGRLYLQNAIDMTTKGEKTAAEVREAMEEIHQQKAKMTARLSDSEDEQTNKDDKNDRPKYLN